MLNSKIRKWTGGEEYDLRILKLIRQLSIVLLLFQICRLSFLIVNFNYFAPIKYTDVVNSFFYGIAFDLSAIVKYNSLYILLILFPSASLFGKTYYRRLINILFISLNSLALLLSVTDIEYFKFVNKRTTYELFYYLRTMHTELVRLLPAYMVQYWPLLILFLAMFILIIRARYIKATLPQNEFKKSSTVRKSALLGFMLLFLFIMGRGGVKSGLKSSDCELVTPVEYNPLTTNTPFVLIESFMNGERASERQCLENNFDVVQEYKSAAPFRSLNVVIIILESFSKEYVGSLNGNKGATPFLDSLIKQSLVCTLAYANGRTTLQALPSILCGEPSIGEIPLAMQMDRIRKLNSIATVLSKAGYGTSFFYGARNGNLGINNFARETGFRSYYGMNECGTKGRESAWGMYDDEFLPFAAKTMDSFREPFVSCILTLSSHSPFDLPKKFSDKFNEQPNPQLKSIAYTDYALEQFFKQVSHSRWYSHTLFVISADHASYSYSPAYSTKTATFAIPILYFCVDDPQMKGSYDSLTQQCDIMPGILDYLHYPLKFESVGSSIFSHSKEHFAVMKLQNHYQYINNEFFVEISEDGSLKNACKKNNVDFPNTDLSGTGNKKLKVEIDRLKTLVKTL